MNAAYAAEAVVDALRTWEPCTALFLKGVLYDRVSGIDAGNVDEIFDEVVGVLESEGVVERDGELFDVWMLSDGFWEDE